MLIFLGFFRNKTLFMYCKDGLKIAFNDRNTKKSYARRTKILLFRDNKKTPKNPLVLHILQKKPNMF